MAFVVEPAQEPLQSPEPQAVDPLDPDSVLDYGVDYAALGRLRNGETILSSEWVLPAGILAGDGSAAPQGPTLPPSIEDGGTKTRVYLYVDQADPPTLGAEVVVTNRTETSLSVTQDVSIRFLVAHT